MATSDDPGTVESEASHPLRKTCDDHIGFRVYDHPTNQTTHTSPYAPHMGYYLHLFTYYICHIYTVWLLCRQKRYSFHHGSHHGISFHHSKCLKPKSLIWPGLIGHTGSQIAHLPLQRHIFRKARVHFSRLGQGDGSFRVFKFKRLARTTKISFWLVWPSYIKLLHGKILTFCYKK